MTGIIQIINEKNHTGKLLCDDGRESRIIQLPESFESGDRAVARFRNDDPQDRLIEIHVPGDNWHYGFVMIKHGKKVYNDTQVERYVPVGNILPTYPAVRELLLYHQNDLNHTFLDENRNPHVKFKIQKSSDGKMKAVDITEVEDKDKFKCYQPKFGKLEVRKEQTKTGIVKKIVREKGIESIPGKISHISRPAENGYQFGFIQRDDKPNRDDNVFFNMNAFRKKFHRIASNGENVNFSISTDSQGKKRVQEFTNKSQKEILSKSKQYGFVEIEGQQKRFSIQKFEEFYNQECIEGDLVYFTEEKGEIVFKQDDSEVVEKVVMNNSFYSRNHGKKVKQSYNCPKSTFQNFVEVEPDELYYLYADKKNVDEVRKFNPKLKSEAISCYKDRNLSAKFRLDAIESLIEMNYSDRNITDENRHRKITQRKLTNEKRSIIAQLRDKQIEKGNHQRAMDFEFRLQEMEYNPQKLSKINIPNKYEIELTHNYNLIELPYSENWEISFDNVDELQEMDYLEKYLINLKESGIDINEINSEENWELDLSPAQIVNPVIGLDDEILINIE